jgi:cytoskeletal protein CcmA (bactofilin family)
MSYPNIIQIKRRLLNSTQTGLPSLTSGELAFTDIDETLFYGLSTEAGIESLPIAGPGAFVSRTKVQDVSGAKTFQDEVIFNAPVTANDTVAINSTLDVLSSVEANSYTIDGTEVIDSSRNAKFVDIDASGNVTITGDLTVLGATTQLDTQTSVTSSFLIENEGSDIALTVNQTGEFPVVHFKDDGNTALFIDGSTTAPGYVGIGTDTPNEKLTVVGKISATDLIYSAKGLVSLGTVSFDGGTITSTGTGSLTINNDLSAAGGNTIITANDATFYQKVNIDDNLTVTGWSNLDNGNVVTDGSGNITISNSVSAAGGNTIITAADATFYQKVNIDDNLTVTGWSNLDNGNIVTDGTGNVTMLGSLSGSSVSNLYNFIIDGGSF